MYPSNLAEHGVLEREVEQRRLIVLDQPIATMLLRSTPAIQAPETPRRSEPRSDRAWVGFMVVDDSVPARPLAGARFRLSLPDRSTRDGALDGQGHFRVDDIEAGKCFLELSDLARESSS